MPEAFLKKQHGGPNRNQGAKKQPGYMKLYALRFETKAEEAKISKLSPRERVVGLLEESGMSEECGVYLKENSNYIGYKWGFGDGGLVYDAVGEIVGAIRTDDNGGFVLSAKEHYHVGHRFDGKEIYTEKPED